MAGRRVICGSTFKRKPKPPEGIGIRQPTVPVENMLKMAPRLAGMFKSAFDLTFPYAKGYKLFGIGPFSEGRYEFSIFENRMDLDGYVPNIQDFFYSSDFLDNVRKIQQKHGFRHISGMEFLDVVNLVKVEIKECASVAE